MHSAHNTHAFSAHPTSVRRWQRVWRRSVCVVWWAVVRASVRWLVRGVCAFLVLLGVEHVPFPVDVGECRHLPHAHGQPMQTGLASARCDRE